MRDLQRKLQPWFAKVLHSIADQATSSGTNFVINVLLARWLSRTEYGAFSVALSFSLVLAAFHNAMILEPMSVVGPAEYASGLSNYLRLVNRLNWYAVVSLGGAAAVIGLFYRQMEVRSALFTLAICLPGYLRLLTIRREQYVVNHPIRAFRISLVYACVAAATLVFFRSVSWLSALTGLICVGTALPVSLWADRRFSLSSIAADPSGIRPVARAHWTYGRWLFASAILAVGISEVQTILLSIFVDLKSAGALRAMMNFILPLSQLATVLSVYTLPRLAQQMKTRGIAQGLRRAIVFPMLITMLAVVYVAVLDFSGPALEHLLYNGKMAQYLKYLPLLCVAALLSAIGAGFSTLLRAAQNSQHQFVAGIAGTLVGIGAALFLLKPYGVAGAIVSMILANAASSACIVVTYIVILRNQPASWTRALEGLFSERPAAAAVD
ncbi:MAG: hypothetical protein WB992_20990 [Bryobacteraceae bacterium]